MLGQDAQGTMAESCRGIGRLTTPPACDTPHDQPPLTASCCCTPSFFGARLLAFDPLVRFRALGFWLIVVLLEDCASPCLGARASDAPRRQVLGLQTICARPATGNRS